MIAIHDGVARAMGLQAVMEEMGLSPRLKMLRVLTDSSAAKSFVATRGLGKMRHIEVKLLWLQEAVQKGRPQVGKVRGTANVADVLTKYHHTGRLEELCRPHGILRVGGAGVARPRAQPGIGAVRAVWSRGVTRR